MSYEFKRLSQVEALTKVPDGAKVLAEVGGVIRRVPGSGLGGSGGIKTAIIKSSNYDQVIQYLKGELPSPPSGDVTYSCINMTFKEAYDALANGEPMTAHLMAYVGVAANLSCLVTFAGTELNNIPCISIKEPNTQLSLFWTVDGVSTTRPGT